MCPPERSKYVFDLYTNIKIQVTKLGTSDSCEKQHHQIFALNNSYDGKISNVLMVSSHSYDFSYLTRRISKYIRYLKIVELCKISKKKDTR